MNHGDIAAVMRGTAPVVRDFVAAATAPLLARIEALEKQFKEQLSADLSELVVPEIHKKAREILEPLGQELLRDAVRQVEELPSLTTRLVAEEVAKLPPAVNGKDGAPGEPGADGAQGERGETGETGPQGEAGPAGEPGSQGEMGVAGESGPQGEPGKDGADADPVEIAEMVREEVQKAIALVPVQKGDQGETGAEGPPGCDGKDADRELVVAVVAEVVEKAVAEIDPPKGDKGDVGEAGPEGVPGRDGKDADRELVAAVVVDVVEKKVSEIEIPRGEKGDRGDSGLEGPAGRDGVHLAGALINRDGGLILTLSDGSNRDLGLIVGRDGAPGEKGVDGKDGRDGFGFEDMDVTYDGERTFAFRWSKGEHVEERKFVAPFPLDRGVYKEGSEYLKGDTVTFGGSLFIAQEDTSQKPETSKAWRLSAKKGRDGKDGKNGERGLQGIEGKAGRDLTQLGPDGTKW